MIWHENTRPIVHLGGLVKERITPYRKRQQRILVKKLPRILLITFSPLLQRKNPDPEGLFPQEKGPLREPQYCTNIGKML
jgi:hypothetical protein